MPSLHGRVEASIGFDLSQFAIQTLLAALVVWVFALAHRRLESPQRRLLTAAASTLVLAQLMSMIAGQVDGLVLLSVLEESFEMLTGTLLLAAPLPLVLAAARAEKRLTHPSRSATLTG